MNSAPWRTKGVLRWPLGPGPLLRPQPDDDRKSVSWRLDVGGAACSRHGPPPYGRLLRLRAPGPVPWRKERNES